MKTAFLIWVVAGTAMALSWVPASGKPATLLERLLVVVAGPPIAPFIGAMIIVRDLDPKACGI